MSKPLANGENGEMPTETVAAPGKTAEAPAAALSESDQMAAELAAKTREIAELNDKYLRTLAESENIRKRARQQSEETIRLQRENLLRDILPIVDNLERAVQAAQGATQADAIVQGVEMVLRSLLDLLKSHGVSQLSVVGQPFDPARHEAVDQVESAEHPPNTIVSEFHRGYLIGDRMLRPARVTVAKSVTDGGSPEGGKNPAQS